MIAEIIGPSGRVHYRRPEDDPLVDEARRTPGYSVRVLYEQCPKCGSENWPSVNWKAGKSYAYCCDCGHTETP